jgi:cyclophilin family peptidyl-prolyl cis-trans isomerase
MKQILAIVVFIAAITGLIMLNNQQNNREMPAGGSQESGSTLTSELPETEMSELENTIYMEVSTGGRVVIRTFPDKAPNHVARFKELIRQGFYEGIVFHRVIEGFMAQTGDPTGTGSGGSGQNIVAEFNDVHHARGIVSAARSADPDSADSQWFIMLADAPHLDGQYTAWGEVVEGMEFIDALAMGDPAEGGVVPESERGRILTMQVAADLEGAEHAEGDDADDADTGVDSEE